MSTRRLRFFMRPQEFNQIVKQWRDKQGYHLLVPLGNELIVCLDFYLYYEQRELFLTESIPESLVWDTNRIPGKLGWVEVTPPVENNNVLLKAEIASKSDWYDADFNIQQENAAVHSLFRKAAAPVRKYLRFPVWAKNKTYNTPWQPYRDIGYSPGIVEWVKGGGELRQWGVKNIIYSISPDPSSREGGKAER